VPTAATVKSNHTFTLLRMLADGHCRSGEDLAAAIACSHASIADRVREIEQLGLRVETLRGRGYRLEEPLDLLRPAELAGHLRPLRWPFHVEIMDECASTNALLMQRALEGAPHASVLVAEHQTAGRGRRGNSWLSAIGASLAFSLLWRFERGASTLAGLSLAMAVGASRALEAAAVTDVSVKWPNDLLRSGRKLGGILIEMTGAPVGPSACVIGLGLNVRLPRSIAERVDGADLADHGPPSRTRLLALLLEHLATVLDEFPDRGFAALRAEWHERHAWQGCDVALQLGDRCVAHGKAVGVDDDGALLLRSAGGVQRFHSGELSLRPA
jgi:BirA family transcriptional regulator, biotin operon repressor / biotin---[acetyl-CoA-carboxylase] ligase